MARLGLNPVILPPLPYVADVAAPPKFSRRNLWQAQTPDLFRYAAFTLPNRARFDAFAHREDVPGALGVREVKFLVTDVQTPDPILYLMNTREQNLHYVFAKVGLGITMSVQEFNRRTYFSEGRDFLAGSIIAHDTYANADGVRGLYTIEFWPSDIVRFDRVRWCYDQISAALPFARGQIAYHPTGDGQRDLLEREAIKFSGAGIRTVQTTEIFANIPFSPLNLGVTFGRLGVFDGTTGRAPGATDIAIFERLPNDLSRVAGVISEAPQTPLSHVNLRAKQNNVPNAYVINAAKDPRIAPLLGEIVRFEVTPDNIILRAASRAELDAHFDALRPAVGQTPALDMTQKEILPLSALGFADHVSFGAKAANVAELRKILEPHRVPDGFAIPYAFYVSFMDETGLYDQIRAISARSDFDTDDNARRGYLTEIRNLIKGADVPTHLYDRLTTLQAAFPAGVTPRCRSSANAEDLPDFSGAGLYDSFSHKANEGHIANTIKQVWASLWTFRAYEERAFHRIDHFKCAMGVLVHPNFQDERANGVAVTQNIYFATFPGYYVNVQVGEDMVTNPEDNAIAEEFLVIQNTGLESIQEFTTLRIRESNLVPHGGTVMSVADTNVLIVQMAAIQSHFKELYGAGRDKNFAMEIEFKIDRDGVVVVKQARPWTI